MERVASSYDIIVAGGGAAGLSFIDHLLRSGWRDRRVLLIDPVVRETDDRTWCFWEKSPGPFEAIVHHSWPTLVIRHPEGEHRMDIAPYRYKKIRSGDFYRQVNQQIAAAPTITRLVAQVDQSEQDDERVPLHANGQVYEASWCISSWPDVVADKQQHPYLDQHFRGWYIRTHRPAFDPQEAVLMDYRVAQHGNTTFFYVLPTSETEALIEYTIFSNQLLPVTVYDANIAQYLLAHYKHIGRFDTVHTEMGAIPMTTFPYPPRDGRIIRLGTTGGDTRPSTGYTFWNIQQRISRLLDHWQRTGDPGPLAGGYQGRHHWYDKVLLRVLTHGYLPGDQVMYQLFTNNPPQRVLAFLNRETHLGQEVALINSLPKKPFLKAAL